MTAELVQEQDPLLEILSRVAMIRVEDVIAPAKLDVSGLEEFGLLEGLRIRKIFTIAVILELEIDSLRNRADKEEDDEQVAFLHDQATRLEILQSLAREYFWTVAAWQLPEIAGCQSPIVTEDWRIVATPDDPMSDETLDYMLATDEVKSARVVH